MKRAAPVNSNMDHLLKMVAIPKASKRLGIAALLLIIASVGFIIVGPWYEASRNEYCCLEEPIVGEGWIRIGELIFLLAVALLLAGGRLWLQNRETKEPTHLF